MENQNYNLLNYEFINWINFIIINKNNLLLLRNISQIY